MDEATRPSPKPSSGVTNTKPRAPNSDSIVNTSNAKVPDAFHRKAIQSIDAAVQAMSVTRANIEFAESSKEDRNKAVANAIAKASEVVGPLLAPGRHVVNLLSGLGFPPCKQLSSTLSALIKNEVSRHNKDVRVAIIHFDLARALVHIGNLNRKSRPPKSIADPLSKLLKDFKGVIEEFSQFCEAYYVTRAPEPGLKHLLHRKWNKDNLNSFADRIAQLKKSLISLLSQQAVQHPGEHTDVLAQIESRLEKNRAFYSTNEEIAEAFLTRPLPVKQHGKAPVRPVQDGRKQIAGTVGKGVPHGTPHGTVTSSAKKQPTASTSKHVQGQVPKTPPVAKTTTRPGVRAASAPSKLRSTLGKLVPGKRRKNTKSGPPRPPKRKSRLRRTLGKLVPGKRRKNTKSGPPRPPKRKSRLRRTLGKLVPGKRRKNTKSGPPRPPKRKSRLRRTLGKLVPGKHRSPERIHEQEYRDVAGDQELHYPQEDEEIVDGLGVEPEVEVEDGYPYSPEDGSGEGGAYYEEPEPEDEYNGYEPAEDDEYDQRAYSPQDDADGFGSDD
ncbi:hypothetical protein F5888DRAFT_1630810 [Russula emetica]|nr:hypothetical protein F5888DRAFT_1630810 [Russula emetica]